MIRRSIEVAAEASIVFDLTQDYARRLDWDPFLREARPQGGVVEPGRGVRVWCVARSGLGMETTYVSFRRPHACAVAMTRGPWFFRSFAGSWRFDPLGLGQTRVTFTYRVVGRPKFLTQALRSIFDREMRRRLWALRRFVQRMA